jgi:hypothetical protein
VRNIHKNDLSNASTPPAGPSGPIWGWCPLSTPRARHIRRAGSPRPATAMPAGCSSKRPGITEPRIGRDANCGDGGMAPHRQPGPADKRPTNSYTLDGAPSINARNAPWSPTPRSPVSSPASAGHWPLSTTDTTPNRPDDYPLVCRQASRNDPRATYEQSHCNTIDYARPLDKRSTLRRNFRRAVPTYAVQPVPDGLAQAFVLVPTVIGCRREPVPQLNAESGTSLRPDRRGSLRIENSLPPLLLVTSRPRE